MKTIINGLNKLKAGQQIDDAELRYRVCEEAKKAVEKQAPKKVIYYNEELRDEHGISYFFQFAECPSCETIVTNFDENEINYSRIDLILKNIYQRAFCPYCGQALDWSEE